MNAIYLVRSWDARTTATAEEKKMIERHAWWQTKKKAEEKNESIIQFNMEVHSSSYHYTSTDQFNQNSSQNLENEEKTENTIQFNKPITDQSS
jgi:hypothetical protein